jgi:hypothetical protein
MPTHEEDPLFLRELAKLTLREQTLFAAAVRKMVEDIRTKRPFRPSLRVKGVKGYPGIFEMTWEMPDGRATFHYGISPHAGDVHIVWRRIGGHDIFDTP